MGDTNPTQPERQTDIGYNHNTVRAGESDPDGHAVCMVEAGDDAFRDLLKETLNESEFLDAEWRGNGSEKRKLVVLEV